MPSSLQKIPPGRPGFPLRRQQQAWLDEYLGGGDDRIESSYTVATERSVLWFKTWLERRGLCAGKVLDLGCGRGRNSLPFLKAGWSVAGLDAAAPALRDFRAQASRLSRRLDLRLGDLARPLPWASAVFDAVMEVTAADNLINRSRQNRLWPEIARVLKPGGYLFSYHFNRTDGYYGPLLAASPSRARGVLYDARAHMHFRFYTAADIRAAAGGALVLLRRRRYGYPGPMFGRSYQRDLTAAIFQRGKG